MTEEDEDEKNANAMSWRLRAWLRPGPETCCWGRGLSERSEFRSPSKRDRGKGTPGATTGREWFWVLLPKQKDLVVRGGETPPTSRFLLLNELVETLDAQRFIDL